MKTYEGYRLGDRAYVVVHDDIRNIPRRTKPLYHLSLHSPEGFNWGYGGSGPADLALAILADHLNEKPDYYELREGYFRFPDEELLSTTESIGDIYERHRIKSYQYHQYFKADVISRLPKDRWTLTDTEVAEWIAEFNKKRGTA